ncbi:MAG: hypothetical protein J07HN6_02744 [Halonotius sp. J07HN6]|jgi:hypothetical protein|nr:MAG: hypothetical protein J07HN6_02744 [Halonotius sp. J07HN6]ESS09013.1 MAG: phospholipase D-nuclease [uncultured archaeon A07HN63]
MPSGITLFGVGPVALVGTVVSVLMLLVQLALVVWTYTDAKNNTDQPAFLWAIVVFLAPLLGLVLYFLLGRE